MKSEISKYQVLKYLTLLNHQIDSNPNKDLSLFDGDMAKVLYYFYYGNSLNKPDFVQKGGRLLEYVIKEIENGNASYLKNCTLSSGLSGLGLTIEILISEGYVEDNFESLLKRLDTFIFTDALKILKIGYTDFLHAGFGAILYLFYRLDRNPDVEEYLKTLLVVVKKNQVFISNDQAYIPNNFLTEFVSKKGSVSIGLAHGQTGYALILLKFIEKGILVKLTESILHPLLNFIWSLYIPDPEHEESSFPFFFHPDFSENRKFYIKSLRWCYGDLNALHLLYSVNALYPNEKLSQKAYLLGKRVLTTQADPKCCSRHTLLCHGSTGIGYYFKKLYELSGNKEYYEAYKYSINISFRFFDEEFKDKKITEISGGFLDGFVGSSLVLLNAINPDAEYWDKLLLFS